MWTLFLQAYFLSLFSLLVCLLLLDLLKQHVSNCLIGHCQPVDCDFCCGLDFFLVIRLLLNWDLVHLVNYFLRVLFLFFVLESIGLVQVIFKIILVGWVFLLLRLVIAAERLIVALLDFMFGVSQFAILTNAVGAEFAHFFGWLSLLDVQLTQSVGVYTVWIEALRSIRAHFSFVMVFHLDFSKIKIKLYCHQ